MIDCSPLRATRPGVRDARLMDEALSALCRERHNAEIDRQYEAYERTPLNACDEWGDVESFLSARRRQ